MIVTIPSTIRLRGPEPEVAGEVDDRRARPRLPKAGGEAGGDAVGEREEVRVGRASQPRLVGEVAVAAARGEAEARARVAGEEADHLATGIAGGPEDAHLDPLALQRPFLPPK